VTLFPLLLVLLTESCAVTGQICFKHAMSGRDGIKAARLTMGIAAMAVNFFLWNGLLSRFDLSYLYPFDGLNRIILVIAASIFLKEKMTLNLWVGVGLICAGVLLVSSS
jgi:uncharacterized membrane protein